jgi:hypothetical protein
MRCRKIFLVVLTPGRISVTASVRVIFRLQ